MKALTISQPFASLIARGEKFVENRRWPTSYRGDLAIHAGRGMQYLSRHELQHYTTGAIVALATLRTCFLLESVQARWRERRSVPPQLERDGISLAELATIFHHKHTEGPYCWVLSNVRPIEPVACKGAQGLWEWDAPAFVFKPFPERQERR